MPSGPCGLHRGRCLSFALNSTGRGNAMTKIGEFRTQFAKPLWVLGLATLLAAPACPALAQNTKLEEVAGYQGADRASRLLEGAKREGEITVYSSMPVEDNTAVIGAFEKKYGLKVKVWRG